MSETVEEHRARRRASAIDAMARGQAALEAGDLDTAQRWLDRARRVSGGNDAVELLLASARLRLGHPGAAALFAALARRHDLREAWLGLASVRLRERDAAAAAAALAEALAGHVGALPAAMHATAEAIARAVGAPGWCCLTEPGALWLSDPATAALTLDGEPAPSPLPTRHGRLLTVTTPRGQPLGSPFQLARMRRLDAFVDADGAGGLTGWAWHPNDPTRSAALTVRAPDGATAAVPLGRPGSAEPTDRQQHDRPLAQRRRFALPAAALPGPGLLDIIGPDGRSITGAPIDPGAALGAIAAATSALADHPADPAALRQMPIPAAYVGPAPDPPATPHTATSVVIPVYRGEAATLACLDSVFAHSPPGTRVIVVDDASPEPGLSAQLDALAAAGRIRLIRNARNRGFPAAANAGLRAAAPDDVILLNADTLVAPFWLETLHSAVSAGPAIASATPLSNDATLVSYPRQQGGNALPTHAQLHRLARLARRANAGRIIDIPTGVGFCLYLRRAALDDVGLLREDVFAQGYGEENDWCLRARNRGWRHVAAPAGFVAHLGGTSFGATRDPLLARNLRILNRLHPGYDALIAADTSGPALAGARRRLDLARLAARRRPAGSVVLITHDLGGGVERQVRARCAAIRAAGDAAIIIRPILALPLLQGTGACRVDLGDDLPNLIFDIATELPALATLLARQKPRLIEVHHMLGHDHALMALPARLGVAYDIHLHDYAWFCERVSLVGFERRYCGEPDVAGCEACICDAGRNIDEDIPVASLVARSARQLAGAARVIAPSADTAARFARHFPGLRATVTPWDDARPACHIPRPPAATATRPRRVGILGAIGIEKGYDVLLACGRDAAARSLPLQFIVLGHTTDDARLLQTGHVFITGEYAADDLATLLAAEQIDLAWLPSIWPETWSFTLSEAWRAGLHVVAFDIGAPAERIRTHGGGTLVPLACRAGQVNAVLLG